MIPGGLQDAAIVEALNAWDPDAVVDGVRDRGQVTLMISPDKIRETCRHLKQEEGFVRLSGITAVRAAAVEVPPRRRAPGDHFRHRSMAQRELVRARGL